MAFVNLIKFLDKRIGAIVCLILSLFNPKAKKIAQISDGKKVLLVQLWGLGETILCLPAIKELRHRYKGITIDVLTTKRVNEVFYDNRSINSIKIISLNPLSIKLFILKNLGKYDLAIDMEEYLNISAIISFCVAKERIGYSHGIRSKLYTEKIFYNDRQHAAQAFMDLLRPLGIYSKASRLKRLGYPMDDTKKVDSLLKSNNIGKKEFIVGFGFGAAESVRERMWPAERFAELADYLIKKLKTKVILVGNKEEMALGDKIKKLSRSKDSIYNFAGQTNITEMFYLISLCRLFVGNDAGPMHVAAAQNVKTIGLFGCNLPVRFGPLGKKNAAIRKQKGKPCINVHKGEVGMCRYGFKNACVKKIQVKDITKIMDKLNNF